MVEEKHLPVEEDMGEADHTADALSAVEMWLIQNEHTGPNGANFEYHAVWEQDFFFFLQKYNQINV